MTTTDTKERPILFNADMVRAILDGPKTETRRVVKLRGDDGRRWSAAHRPQQWGESDFAWIDLADPCGTYPTLINCPYGVPGDRLWVRETFRASGIFPNKSERQVCLVYRAGGESQVDINATWHQYYDSENSQGVAD